MCQLFGLNSSFSVTASVSLHRFFQRGGGTDEHGDGWGLAYYQNKRSHLIVDHAPAHSSERAGELVQQKVTSDTFIAHIRKATQGAVDTSNCHPFNRQLWQKDWSFAHNGHVPKAILQSQGHYQPVGETDSEAAFCLILNSLAQAFGNQQPDAAQLGRFIHDISTRIARFGTFNFLLSDGHQLIAFCSNRLFWTQRASGQSSALHEEFAQFEFPANADAAGQITLVATQPITDEDHWQAFLPNQTIVFVNGRTVFESVGEAVLLAG